MVRDGRLELFRAALLTEECWGVVATVGTMSVHGEVMTEGAMVSLQEQLEQQYGAQNVLREDGNLLVRILRVKAPEGNGR